jgi:hypothetical protein
MDSAPRQRSRKGLAKRYHELIWVVSEGDPATLAAKIDEAMSQHDFAKDLPQVVRI